MLHTTTTISHLKDNRHPRNGSTTVRREKKQTGHNTIGGRFTVRNKGSDVKAKNLKGKLIKNLQGKETNVMGKQERITDEKGNFRIV